MAAPVAVTAAIGAGDKGAARLTSRSLGEAATRFFQTGDDRSAGCSSGGATSSLPHLRTPRGIYVAPNGGAFVTASVMRGILPLKLSEILDSHVMAKAMPKGVAADSAAAQADGNGGGGAAPAAV